MRGVKAVTAARAGIVAGGALVGVLSAGRAYDVGQPWLWASDAAVATAFAVVAALAVPHTWRVAVLAAATCTAWSLASWWPFAAFWHRGTLVALLVLLIVGSRSLWPRRPFALIVTAAAYAASITPFFWRSDAAALAFGIGLVVAAAVLRPRRSTPGAVEGAVALGLLGLVFAAAAAIPLVTDSALAYEVRAVGYAVGLVVVGAIAAFAVRPGSIRGARDAVVQLGAEPDDAVRDRLRTALRDGTLEIGWWSPGEERYLTRDGDEVGRSSAAERPGELRIDEHGRPLAIVVGGSVLLDDADVRDAVVRASALTAEHQELTTRLRASADEVQRSQTRLIESAAAERQAIADELEREVGRPLRQLRARLGRLDPDEQLRPAGELIERALGELTAIAAGLSPVRLDAGLEKTLRELARRAPVTVEVQVDHEPDEEATAQTAYFICAEALANALRHSDCTRVAMRLSQDGDSFDVSVADDGKGGAAVGRGTGLAGLRDRVAVMGGSLHISSRAGSGTVVAARLPVAMAPVLVEERA
jgi:signal transduction histidine kinase